MSFRHCVLMLILIASLAACDTAADLATNVETESQAAQAQPTPTIGTSSEATVDIIDRPTDIPPVQVPTSEPATSYTAPEWASLSLTNATTGEIFSLADFAGKTVFVEPMATWCSNCRQQQRQVVLAMDTLDRESYVFISLSVEAGLPDTALAEYAKRNEFQQIFAVASDEMLTALVNQYGRTIITPPLTPHFIIAPDGTLSDLVTGYHSSTQITDELRAVTQQG